MESTTKKPSAELASQIRRNLVNGKGVKDACSEAIEDAYGITDQELWSVKRYEEVAFCRMVIYFTLHKTIGITSARVGRILGKDHGTILSGCKRIKGLMDVDRNMRIDVKLLSERIESKLAKMK